jgi:hypothetical protein
MGARSHAGGRTSAPAKQDLGVTARCLDPDVQMMIPEIGEIKHRITAVAVALASTEEQIAETLDQMAAVRPHAEARLRGQATHARRFAARLRRQGMGATGSHEQTPNLN